MSTDALQVPQTLAGRCMCGAVHYTISEKSLADGLCHCDRCRLQFGSAFSTVIFIHRSALTITGETAVFDDVGSSALRVLRRYCPRCGSPLTTEPDLTSELFMVKAGTLDSTNGSIRCGSCSPAGADLGIARSPAPMAILRSR